MGGCVSVQLSCDQALTQACGCFFSDGNPIHMLESNLEVLEKTMQELKERRDDLSRRVSIEEDQGFNSLLKSKDGFQGYKVLSLSYEYGEKVSKKLKEVQELLSKGAFDVLSEKALVAKVGKQHIQATVGKDSMVEKAWNILKNPKGTTLGLYGMGGVGKTTLLARINNKFNEDVNDYDVVIWIVVSKDFQIEGIQNHILGRVRPDKKWKQETEEEKASSIYNILSRKKFVLLLDDIWSEVDLNKIGVPPPTRENRSKIVFTTRSKEVCRAMKADEDMKIELFRNIVGETPLKRHEDIPTLARKVVDKCCGLPLALTVIGKAMASKEYVHEWRHALNLLNSPSHDFPGMEEKILSILKFSYDGLGNENVKSCFLYCSLFPEDYEIKKKELIEYWIGEGLINGNREEDGSSSHGHAIIGSLGRAHLLMDVDGKFTECVKMHDVLREMALWIASDFVKSGGQLNYIPNDIEWEVVRRISLMSNQISKISYFPNCPSVSSLILRYNKLKDISGEFFQFMFALIVLDLSYNPLSGLPEEISTLSSLKYLNLSHTKIESLPVGLKGLNKLISLDLEFTYKLVNVDGIGTNLPNLQVLKLFDSRVWNNAKVMEELHLLENLEILTATIKDPLILERVQGVKRVANSIRCLRLMYMSEEVVVLNTTSLSGLQRLLILNSKISEIKITWERSKERERILCKSSLGFKHLTSVEILNLEGQKDLTWLLFAQNLRSLSVHISSCIEEIIDGEKATSVRNMHPYINVPFAKLEYLDLRQLHELKRICSSPPGIPNLKEFVVLNCTDLPLSFRDINTYNGRKVSPLKPRRYETVYV